jgi:hypothetical protein
MLISSKVQFKNGKFYKFSLLHRNTEWQMNVLSNILKSGTSARPILPIIEVVWNSGQVMINSC